MGWTDFDNLLDFAAFLQDTRVSKWPRSGSKRIACEFRMGLGEGKPFPRPDRFICQMHDVPGAPNGRLYAYVDMDVAGPFHIFGTSGLNVQGRTIDLDIVEHLTADFDGSDFPGIEYHFVIKKTGSDDFNWTWYFESESPPGTQRDIPMRADSSTPGAGVVEQFDDPQFLDVDWPPIAVSNQLQWFTMSECYDFPELAPPLGKAEFNGVDAQIDLQMATGVDSGPFFLTMDLILYDRVANPFLGFSAANSAFQMIGEQLFWGPVAIANNIFPANGVPFNLKVEFEWSKGLQLTYTTWIDDIEVAQVTTNRQSFNIDQLGKRNQLGSAVFGHFDMWNLLFIRGTFAVPIVELDMVLDQDACDAGPMQNDGTTINMNLPSCARVMGGP